MPTVGILFEDLDLIGILDQLKPLLVDTTVSHYAGTAKAAIPKGKPLDLSETGYTIYLDFGPGGVSHNLRAIDQELRFDPSSKIQWKSNSDRSFRTYEAGPFGVPSGKYGGRRAGEVIGWNEDVSIGEGYFLIPSKSSSARDVYEMTAEQWFWLRKNFSVYLSDKFMEFPEPGQIPKFLFEHGIYAAQEFDVLPQIGSSVAFPCDIYAVSYDDLRKHLKGKVYLQVPYDKPVYIANGVSLQATSIEIYRPFWDRDDFRYQNLGGDKISPPLPFMSEALSEIDKLPEQIRQMIGLESSIPAWDKEDQGS